MLVNRMCVDLVFLDSSVYMDNRKWDPLSFSNKESAGPIYSLVWCNVSLVSCCICVVQFGRGSFGSLIANSSNGMSNVGVRDSPSSFSCPSSKSQILNAIRCLVSYVNSAGLMLSNKVVAAVWLVKEGLSRCTMMTVADTLVVFEGVEVVLSMTSQFINSTISVGCQRQHGVSEM